MNTVTSLIQVHKLSVKIQDPCWSHHKGSKLGFKLHLFFKTSGFFSGPNMAVFFLHQGVKVSFQSLKLVLSLYSIPPSLSECSKSARGQRFTRGSCVIWPHFKLDPGGCVEGKGVPFAATFSSLPVKMTGWRSAHKESVRRLAWNPFERRWKRSTGEVTLQKCNTEKYMMAPSRVKVWLQKATDHKDEKRIEEKYET